MKRILLCLAISLVLFCHSGLQAQTWSAYTPQATTNSLFGVFALDATTAWAVGNNGAVLKWNGTSWVAETSGVVAQRLGVWAADASHVWAVGASTGNQLIVYNGATWANGTAAIGWGTGSIRSVWGTSSTNVWITGAGTGTVGRAYRWNGTSWALKNTGLPGTLSGQMIWGTDANNVWIVGSTGATGTGTILRWNPGTDSWDTQLAGNLGNPNFKAIWGSDANNVWAVGGEGTGLTGKIFKWNGVSWSNQTPAGGIVTLNSISGSNASNIWAAGNGGTVLKWNGSNWNSQSSGTSTNDFQGITVGKTASFNRLWIVGAGSASVNPLYTGTVAITLPLSWLSFTAQLTGRQVALKWITAQEQNTSSFQVEYQNSAGEWNAIVTVVAAGQSTSRQSYSFIHLYPRVGQNMYRLRQVDIDGKSSFSSVISIKVAEKPEGVTIVSNPVVNGTLEIRCNRPQFVVLYDLNGKQILKNWMPGGLLQINVSGLSKGSYLLTDERATQKIIIR